MVENQSAHNSLQRRWPNLLNINQFLISNSAYDVDDPSTHHHPKTLLDWRWMKKFMKSCCDYSKSGPTDREKLYNTLDRMRKLVWAKGDEGNMIMFMSIAEKFCQFVNKPIPEFKGLLTQEEIDEYLTKK